MFRFPLVPDFLAAIFFHERAEGRVLSQPRGLLGAESFEARRHLRPALGKAGESLFQERHLYPPNPAVFHRTSPQLLEIDLTDNVVEVSLGQIFRRSGNEMKRRWFQGNRANRVIRTVIAAHFIDRQNLNQPEPDLRRPIDELPEPLEIADAQVVLRAQRKQRRQHSGNLLFRRQIHMMM